MSDIDELTQLVLHERQGRDRCWWQQMRECFWPDSLVHLSWFTGSGPDFVDASEAMSGRGDASVHRLSPPIVHVVGERATIEVPAAIEVGVTIDGVRADLVSYTRIQYRAERRVDEWRIAALDTIYERDSLTPSVPGTVVHVDASELAEYRRPYALLAYHLARRGYTITGDLYGDDRPDEVEEFYADERAWLLAG